MLARELHIEGAFEFVPDVYPDERGSFLSSFQLSDFQQALGRSFFPLAQASMSLSRRGVVRGPHFTRTPPGMAKYVYCARGSVLDVVLDIRIGSPTFGQWQSVLLSADDFRALYLPVGLAHMFIVLAEGSVMHYMLSTEYVAGNELALSPFDPQLRLPIPADIDPILSERDKQAPTFAEARALGMLPDYQVCQELTAKLSGDHG